MIATVHETVTDLIDQHRADDGYSTDEYHDERVQHPMAEAKYILACIELTSTGLMSRSEFVDRTGESVARLHALRVEVDAGQAGWGLGFAYGDGTADATYVITTALVAQALHTARLVAPDVSDATTTCLLESAINYLLAAKRVPAGNGRLVAYGPSNEALTYNVTAMWAGVLCTVLDPNHPALDEARRSARALLTHRIPAAGWTYGPGSHRADLLHTCYIHAGLAMALPDQTQELDLALIEDVLQFSGSPTWSDRYDIYEVEPLLNATVPGVGRSARISGHHALIGFDAPARTWSMGELLVVASAAAGRSTTGAYWRTQLRLLAQLAVATGTPESHARHAMHLAHGLASVLRAVRTQAGRG